MNSQLLDELIKLHTQNIALMGKLTEISYLNGEEAIMFCIYLEDKPIFAGDFKEKAGLTSGRIATILKQLESKKYIVRSHDLEDRRKTLVQLTDEGRKVIEKEINETIELHKNILEYLGEHDSVEYIRIIKRLLNYISQNNNNNNNNNIF